MIQSHRAGAGMVYVSWPAPVGEGVSHAANTRQFKGPVAQTKHSRYSHAL